MALLDEVKNVCDVLGPLGWRDLLLEVSNGALDIVQATPAKLAAALSKSLLNIDRTRPGFEDFHSGANQAIMAGKPSASLLYHALASPAVHPTANGQPATSPDVYPELFQLDVIENYIYSLNAVQVAAQLNSQNIVIGVFAYQYREASRTTHSVRADLAYSRTGIARVGTHAPNYDKSRRSFWVVPPEGGDALAVLPARYGVFLAHRGKVGASGGVLGRPDNETYLFPFHKLFPGNECIQGRNLELGFLEFHHNEKLSKIHLQPTEKGGVTVPVGFDLTRPPYVRNSNNGGNIVRKQDVGASTLIVPIPTTHLVRLATQIDTVTGQEQIAWFEVPKKRNIRNRKNRFADSSMEIPAESDKIRLAPEYVNIRHQIDPVQPATQQLFDLNTLPADTFLPTLDKGGYAAAHFTDDCGDGVVEAIVNGLPSTWPNFPAYSLVAAPDFMPLANQVDFADQSSIIRTDPLSGGRTAIDPSLPRPSGAMSPAFDPTEFTITAIVGEFVPVASIGSGNRPARAISYLPDAAAGFYAPGWDVSRSGDDDGNTFLTSIGLGSPFPEDAKLCAALASFWPAAAPDNGRTFGNRGWGNQLPMLDSELGFHPKHEQVTSGGVAAYRGWDGEFGPFFEKSGANLFVNYVDIARSDYVSNALAGHIRVSLTAEVQSDDLIARHNALKVCQNILNPDPRHPLDTCLVKVEKVKNWSDPIDLTNPLQGSGFIYEFAEMVDPAQATTELNRVRRKVIHRHLFWLGQNGVRYKKDNGNAVFTQF